MTENCVYFITGLTEIHQFNQFPKYDSKSSKNLKKKINLTPSHNTNFRFLFSSFYVIYSYSFSIPIFLRVEQIKTDRIARRVFLEPGHGTNQ